ncbi:unnamed protein product, partial [marine sediment metagenome]
SIITEEIEDIQSEIAKQIFSNNYSLIEIKEVDMSLEEIFSKMIKED